MIMCLRCQGWSREEVLDLQRHHIERFGWSIVAVQGSPAQAAFGYTIGLTRFHGHPELLVTGLDEMATGAMLNELGAEVRAGRRFRPGDVDRREDGRRLQFVSVNDPQRLIHAQEMYASLAGPVPALQVVHSTPQGRWPWQRGSPGGRRVQPLFGRPVHR